VQRIEGVSGVVNQIRILRLSFLDNGLRIALYRAFYDWNSPLFRYAMRALPPIHIVVENGRLTLKGAVATPSKSQLAYKLATEWPEFSKFVTNLRSDNSFA
jgi:BON domain